jgi:phosphatidylserine/phosphatidylglycerophosphate/cardiolipin synthase-like enzyme
MDAVKLASARQAVAELMQDIALEGPQALGRSDPSRWPALNFTTFEDVTQMTAAVSPDCGYRLVRDAISSAQEQILLYIYNVSADYLVDLLRERRDAGVRIRIMYDTTDSRGGEREKLEGLGVDLRPAPSSGRRQVFTVCHQKYAVIDGRRLLIESANWATTSLPKAEVVGKFRKGNREWLLSIDHQPLAQWYTTLFEADWDIEEMEGPAGGAAITDAPMPRGPVMAPALLVEPPDIVYDQQSFTCDPPAIIVPVVSPNNYYDVVHALILDAKESVYVQQQYILAGGPKTEGLLDALETVAQRGVDVRLMASAAFRKVGKKDSWELSVDSADAFGLKDRIRALSLDTFTHLHNKGVVVDRSTVVVSSTNWSENSITKAREAGVVVACAPVAAYFAAVFETDWESGWDPADVPENLMQLAADALFKEGGFTEIPPADLA